MTVSQVPIARGDCADVAVIMPHFDCAAFLPAAVRSVLEQRDVALTLFLVDDCSPTDAWRDAVAPFRGDRRLVVMRTSRNVGPWRIKNRLFARLDCPYIAFQDADDLSHPDRLRLQLDELERHALDIVGSSFYEIAETGEVLRLKHMPRHVNFAFARGDDYPILHGTTLMRRAVLGRLGGFDGTDHGLAADTDFFLRGMFAARMRNIRRPLYHYRRRAASLTGAPETGFNSAARDAYYARMMAEHRARRARWLVSLLPLPGRRPLAVGARPNDVAFELSVVEAPGSPDGKEGTWQAAGPAAR